MNIHMEKQHMGKASLISYNLLFPQIYKRTCSLKIREYGKELLYLQQSAF